MVVDLWYSRRNARLHGCRIYIMENGRKLKVTEATMHGMHPSTRQKFNDIVKVGYNGQYVKRIK